MAEGEFYTASRDAETAKVKLAFGLDKQDPWDIDGEHPVDVRPPMLSVRAVTVSPSLSLSLSGSVHSNINSIPCPFSRARVRMMLEFDHLTHVLTNASGADF